MKKRPIIIQGALQSEIDLLLERLSPTQRCEMGGCVFYEAIYRNMPIVISKTKMGEIAAAIATTVAIERYHPAWILNQGTAGACAEELHTGDVIVGERAVYLSQYATAADREGDPLNPWKSESYRSLDGERISLSVDERLLSFLKSLPIGGSVRFGAVGSGDVWTTDKAEIRSNHERLGILCEAMECTGVYMAANSWGVPAVSVRVISNNELLGESYLPRSAEIAQAFAIQLIDAWVDLLQNSPF